MLCLRACRVVLAALLLAWLGAPVRAQADSPCADDGCGCHHERRASECCCVEDGPATRAPAQLAPPPSRAELLAELRAGKDPRTPVLSELNCRRTRRTPGVTGGMPTGTACGLATTPTLARRGTWARTRLVTSLPLARAPEPPTPPPRG